MCFITYSFQAFYCCCCFYNILVSSMLLLLLVLCLKHIGFKLFFFCFCNVLISNILLKLLTIFCRFWFVTMLLYFHFRKKNAIVFEWTQFWTLAMHWSCTVGEEWQCNLTEISGLYMFFRSSFRYIIHFFPFSI